MGPRRPGDLATVVADPGKACRDFSGWKTKRTLEEIQVQIDSGPTIGRRLAQDDAAGGSKLAATDNEVQAQPKP